jgi:hypothetical protein
VGTPAVRSEQVARLDCAYYYEDPQVIDETSARDALGVFRYRDPRRPRRVANALIRAELDVRALTATGHFGMMGGWW